MLVAVLTLLLDVANAREPDFPALDKAGNGNGYLEPSEIPAEDFVIIARYASLVGADISSPVPLSTLGNGRLKYFELLDRSKELGSVWEPPAKDQEFGRLLGTPGVRPFGQAGKMAGEYTSRNQAYTRGTFRNYDANRDGVLSRDEVGAAFKTALTGWFAADHDKNGLLTFTELADYYAADTLRRKMSKSQERSTWKIGDTKVTERHRQHAEWLMGKFDKNKNGTINRDEVPEEWKTGNGLSWADADGDGQITKLEMQVGAVRFLNENDLAADRKTDPNLETCDTLASDMIRRYDRNNDRALDRNERAPIGGDLSAADINSNGLIQHEELSRWMLARLNSQPSAGLPEGLPVWFIESDIDLDGQVLLDEFLKSNPRSATSEFERYDHNRDGIVTADESVSRTAGGKMRFASSSPRVFESGKETYSEVFIGESLTIADIDVQVTITKQGDDDIALLLIGPNGETATLYYTAGAKPWGGGRLFADTLIDDEAPDIPQRLRLPPAHRSFRPQGMKNRRMNSLSVFYGQPARGTWRLVIRNNSRVAGLLGGWALLVKSSEPVEPELR